MKPSKIYKSAAKRISYGENIYCCNAIRDLCFLYNAAWFDQEQAVLINKLASYFKPEDENIHRPWFNKPQTDEDYGDEGDWDEETQNHRVLALLFMSEIVKGEENAAKQ